ncbi:MAG: MFS transporter [Vulcanimicrobiaceae bacterium]
MRKPPRATWALVAAIIGSSMSFIDGSAVNVALPVLQRELHATAAASQWVVESYALSLSALILIGGSLGDLFGRKRVYGVGIAVFALASIVCAVAPSVTWLIVGRSVQGVGGALATPGSLALISATYSGEARGRAIGTWSGAAGIFAALGPVLGGALVQFGSWRYVFVINVPLAALVLAILVYGVDESRDDTIARRVDVWGAIFATLGLGALVYGLIDLQGAPGPFAFFAISLGAAALVVFAAIEARGAQPMMPLHLFKTRRFALANAYTFLLYAALGGSLFFVPFDLINVQHYPPSLAGGALLPMIGIMFVFSRMSGGLVARIGARGPLALGATLAASGFLIFANAGVGQSYWSTFFVGSVVLGFGAACFVAPLTTTVMDSLEPAHAGIASGVNNAVSRTAGLVAIAALGIALAGAFAHTLDRTLANAHLSRATGEILARERATIVAGHVPLDITDLREHDVVARAIALSYVDGFHLVTLVSALMALAAAPLALDASFRRVSTRRVSTSQEAS